ncbi:MAG: hypothetical protein QM687_06595 [Ferruginibacter sp.]
MLDPQISQTNDPAIQAENTSTGAGIWSKSKSGAAVAAQSTDGQAISGESMNGQGIWGASHAKYHAGVTGINHSQEQEAGPGVYGTSKGTGVWGESETWCGVAGFSKSKTGGAGVYGKGNIAGMFEGDVNIPVGNLNVQSGLITINGVSLWGLIHDLQVTINQLSNGNHDLSATISNLQVRVQVLEGKVAFLSGNR